MKQNYKRKKKTLRDMTFEILHSIIKNKAANILLIMDSKFKKKFRLDAEGIPRKWAYSDDIKSIFTKAKAETETILDHLSIMRLNEPDDKLSFFLQTERGLTLKEDTLDVPDSLQIISVSECGELLHNFCTQCEGPYLEAQRDQENASARTSVPLFVIVLIAVLGFDEFWKIITNPLWTIFVVILGGGVFIVYKLGLPLQPLLQYSLSSVIRWIEAKVAPAQNNKDKRD